MTQLSWLPLYQHRINDAISRFFAKRYPSHIGSVESEFISAIRHAVEGGGKRLRPILAVLAYEEAIGEICPDSVIDGFIGIEFIHCYTLVHDDLPCMDNDILRRGKPTVWKQYGETMAVLVGDALQTMGFELIATLGSIHIISEITHATGDLGVVYGQVRDTLADQMTFSVIDIMRLHDEKTGGFIASCLVIGGILGNMQKMDLERFREYGILLGRAFQIRDDVLDYEGETSILGKTVRKDQKQGKGLVSLIGIDQTKKILEDIGVQIDSLLEDIKNPKFVAIKQYVMERES